MLAALSCPPSHACQQAGSHTSSTSPAPHFRTHPPLPLAGPMFVCCTSPVGSFCDLLGAHPTHAACLPTCFGPKSPSGLLPRPSLLLCTWYVRQPPLPTSRCCDQISQTAHFYHLRFKIRSGLCGISISSITYIHKGLERRRTRSALESSKVVCFSLPPATFFSSSGALRASLLSLVVTHPPPLLAETDGPSHWPRSTLVAQYRSFSGQADSPSAPLSPGPASDRSDTRRGMSTGQGGWCRCGTRQGTVKKVNKFKAHSNWVPAVDVLPDSTKITTRSDDWTACIWSLLTGRQLLNPWNHDHRVFAVNFRQSEWQPCQ